MNNYVGLVTSKRVIVIFICIFIMTGCAQKQIVDDVALIRGISYDQDEENQVKVKFAVPIFKQEKSEEMDYYTSFSNTSKGGRFEVNIESPRALVNGQLAIALYGDELARKGISDLIDVLHRDPEIGNRLKLAIVKGTASELLSKDLTTVGMRPPMYLANLIDQNEYVETLPRTNLHLFLYSYYSDGKDPILPLIEKQENHAEIAGIALFKGDKYVDSLPMDKAYIIRMFSEEGFRSGTFEVKLEDDKKKDEKKDKEEENHVAVIENIKSLVKIDINKDGAVPTFNFDVNLTGLIKEYTGKVIAGDEKRITKIKNALKEKIETESNKAIKEFIRKQIDPLGLGERYRSTTRDWDPKEWENLYPKIKLNINVDVKIIESGVVE